MGYLPKRTRSAFLRFFWIAAISAALILAVSHPAESQSWVKKTFGRLTFEVPADWKDMSIEVATQKIWYTGDRDAPDAIFSVVQTVDLNEIMGGLKVESKRTATVGGKSAVCYTGSPKEEMGKGILIVLDEKEPGGGTLALIGSFLNEAAWNQHRSVFDHIVGSAKFQGAATPPSCVWDSFTNDPRQFATQPGGVFPMRRNYTTGQYLVHVGPAGKNGLAIPPAIWRTFGPFEVTAGNKYAAIIQKGLGTVCELMWEKNSARLQMYSNPPAGSPGLAGYAVVYVRNDSNDQWYALCLEPVGAPGGKPELHFDASLLQTIKAGGTYTFKARASHIPPDVKRLKFSWYLHLNECLSSNPPGNKVNFWYFQFIDVRNGEAECSIVIRAEARKKESTFSLLVQDEPYTQKVFLSTRTITYQIQ